MFVQYCILYWIIYNTVYVRYPHHMIFLLLIQVQVYECDLTSLTLVTSSICWLLHPLFNQTGELLRYDWGEDLQSFCYVFCCS